MWPRQEVGKSVACNEMDFRLEGRLFKFPEQKQPPISFSLRQKIHNLGKSISTTMYQKKYLVFVQYKVFQEIVLRYQNGDGGAFTCEPHLNLVVGSRGATSKLYALLGALFYNHMQLMR